MCENGHVALWTLEWCTAAEVAEWLCSLEYSARNVEQYWIVSLIFVSFFLALKNSFEYVAVIKHNPWCKISLRVNAGTDYTGDRLHWINKCRYSYFKSLNKKWFSQFFSFNECSWTTLAFCVSCYKSACTGFLEKLLNKHSDGGDNVTDNISLDFTELWERSKKN